MPRHLPTPAIRRKKSCSETLRYLEYAPRPNHTEFRGLLLGSVESPSKSRSMSLCIIEAVLKYVSRTRCDELFPDVCRQVSDHFDGIMATLWRRSQSKLLSGSQFLRARRQPVALLLSLEDAVVVNS